MRVSALVFRNALLALAVLLAMGCDSRDNADPADQSGQDADSGSSVGVPVDIQSKANRSLQEGLPRGSRTFVGVDYYLENGMMQLGSRVYPEFPLEITQIPVNRSCRAIHFLHSSIGGGYTQPNHPKHEADGTEIGRYVIHYADGSKAEIPLIYGQDLRGWWDWDNNAPVTNSQLVWTGENPKAAQFGRKIRFYWAVWENPHPAKPVATIDFVSANQKAAPFCLAMTLEPVPE